MNPPPVLAYFADLADPRQAGKILYPLSEILLLSLCAVIGGAETFEDIAEYGRNQLDFLRRFFPFLQGTPSHDTLGDVFAALNPNQFAQCFTQWVNSLRQNMPDIIAIDGKPFAARSTPVTPLFTWYWPGPANNGWYWVK